MNKSRVGRSTERKMFSVIFGNDQEFETSQEEQDENQTPDIKVWLRSNFSVVILTSVF